MEVIYGVGEKSVFSRPAGVGLGNFDGLHVGHMVLVNTLADQSKKNQLTSLIYTFKKHPENIIRKEFCTPLITTVSKKIELLSQTSLDGLCFDDFDETFSRMKPEDFVANILVKRLNIRLAVIGFDYKFGYKGQGDGELLKELGKKFGFEVIVIPPIRVDNEIVSSTLIRNTIVSGDMDKVLKLLGRRFSISGNVKHGKNLGHRLGFPTANIQPEGYLVIPAEGVFITETCIDGVTYKSVTSIGRNPTFGDNEDISVETHVLDFTENLYGKNIEVFFVSKIRGEVKFASKEELIEQIDRDILTTRAYFDTQSAT